MIPQKAKTKKVSPEAAAKAELEIASKFPAVDTKKWKDHLDETPTQPDFLKYWAGVLGNSDESKTTLLSILKITEDYPIPGEKQLENKPLATYLKDIPGFKATLAVAHPTGPLVEWNDLPVSRF